MKKIHCDREGCDKSTPEEAPGFGWVQLDSIAMHLGPDDAERQFCSLECVHLATAPDADAP